MDYLWLVVAYNGYGFEFVKGYRVEQNARVVADSISSLENYEKGFVIEVNEKDLENYNLGVIFGFKTDYNSEISELDIVFFDNIQETNAFIQGLEYGSNGDNLTTLIKTKDILIYEQI